MCKYCNCDKATDNGFIGKRIGGRAYPIYIKRYNDEEADFLDGRYWLVEAERYYYTNKNENLDYKDKLHRQVAINFCPVCGRKFEDNYI